MAVLDIWTEIMDRRGIDCIYFDFSKAFDSVPYRSYMHMACIWHQRECYPMD